MWGPPQQSQMTSRWLGKLAIHLPPNSPISFSPLFFHSLSLICFKNPFSSVLSAGFRAPEQSARSLCVALSGAGITLTLRQLKHFIRSTIIFAGKRISRKKRNERVASQQVSTLALWGYSAAGLKSVTARFQHAEPHCPQRKRRKKYAL